MSDAAYFSPFSEPPARMDARSVREGFKECRGRKRERERERERETESPVESSLHDGNKIAIFVPGLCPDCAINCEINFSTWRRFEWNYSRREILTSRRGNLLCWIFIRSVTRKGILTRISKCNELIYNVDYNFISLTLPSININYCYNWNFKNQNHAEFFTADVKLSTIRNFLSR